MQNAYTDEELEGFRVLREFLFNARFDVKFVNDLTFGDFFAIRDVLTIKMKINEFRGVNIEDDVFINKSTIDAVAYIYNVKPKVTDD